MADKSEALKEAYAAVPADTIILETLEIRHPRFLDEDGNVTAVRIVRDYQDLTATLEPDAPMNPGETVVFTAMQFDVTQAGFGDNQVPQIQINIDNVGRVLMFYLEQAISSPDVAEITYREYIPGDLSGPQMDPPVNLMVTDVEADVFQVSITADASSLQNQAFPNRFYTLDQFKGLNR